MLENGIYIKTVREVVSPNITWEVMCGSIMSHGFLPNTTYPIVDNKQLNATQTAFMNNWYGPHKTGFYLPQLYSNNSDCPITSYSIEGTGMSPYLRLNNSLYL